MKKTVLCLLLAALILIPIGVSARGATTIYFTGVNDMVVPLRDSTMPTHIGGALYVPLSVFDVLTPGSASRGKPYLGVDYFYQAENYNLTLSGYGKVLHFDLVMNVSYDGEQQYNYRAYTRNGNLYVPLVFVTRHFGLRYSLISTDYATVVRITSSAAYMDDMLFLNSAKTTLAAYYDAYMQAASPSPGTPGVSPSPPSHETERVAYLTFEGGPTEYTPDILTLLSDRGVLAAFFLSPDMLLAEDETVRRVYGEGHTVGLSVPYFEGASADEYVASLSDANDTLDFVLGTRTRLIRFPEGSRNVPAAVRDACVEAGYRYWDYHIDGEVGETTTSSGLSSRTISRLRNRAQTATVRLYLDGVTAGALPTILNFLELEKYTLRRVTQSEMPQNGMGDVR